MTPLRPFAAALLVLSFAAPALSQIPDYSGTWSLDTTVLLAGEATPCIFTGSVTIQQQGIALSGNAIQILSSGPAACPPFMMAAVSGQIDMMGCVELGALSGPLGSAAFVACPGEAKDSLEGTFQVESGPFAGGGGDWIAVLGAAAIAVPTLSDVGLVALAVLMLVAGAWVMRRRHRMV